MTCGALFALCLNFKSRLKNNIESNPTPHTKGHLGMRLEHLSSMGDWTHNNKNVPDLDGDAFPRAAKAVAMSATTPFKAKAATE
jgi:hypothetical protein